MDEMIDQLMRILLPQDTAVVVQQVHGQRDYDNVVIKMTHNNLLFEAENYTIEFSYGKLYAISIITNKEVLLKVNQFNLNTKQNQMMEITLVSEHCPLIVNSLQYRMNIYRLWSRRLQSGIVKSALRHPMYLAQLSQNRTLFGQVNFETLENMSILVKECGFKSRQCDYFVMNGQFAAEQFKSKKSMIFSQMNFELIIQNQLSSWRDDWPWKGIHQSSETEESTSKTASLVRQNSIRLTQGVTKKITKACTLQNVVDDMAEQMEIQEMSDFKQTYLNTKKQREKVKRISGHTEQVRMKISMDYQILNCTKIYHKFLEIKNFDPFSKQFQTFEQVAQALKKEIGRMKNTLVHDFRPQFEALQLVKELVMEDIEQLDPVIIKDIASISAEEMVFGALFQPLFKRCQQECAETDKNVFLKCQKISDEEADLYDVLEIPEKFRDPCEYQLAVDELKQIESAVNFHPRYFLNCILETVFAIQLTVRFSTKYCIDDVDRVLSMAADDLIPLLIYVFVRAGLTKAFTIQKFCDDMMDDSLKNDEYGNVLIHLQSAINWVMDSDITDQMKIQTQVEQSEKKQQSESCTSNQVSSQVKKEGE